MNVTVPLTLLPAVGCSTEMPFDDVADFAAGVCASAMKPANDASASPMKEALSEFMSAFVVRTSRHVQSHQCSREDGGHGVTGPILKRGPSTALCRMRVRSGHNRKFFRPLRRRGR